MQNDTTCNIFNMFPATTTFICVIRWWRVNFFPNFTSLTFFLPTNITGDKLPSQSWVVLVFVSRTSYAEKLGHSIILALCLQVAEFFDKIPVRILLDVLFRAFRVFLIVFYCNVFRVDSLGSKMRDISNAEARILSCCSSWK